MSANVPSFLVLANALGDSVWAFYAFFTGAISVVYRGGIELRDALKRARQEWPRNLEIRYGKQFSIEHATTTAKRAELLDWGVFAALASTEFGSFFLAQYYMNQQQHDSADGMITVALLTLALLYALPGFERRVLIRKKLNSLARWNLLRRGK